MPLIAVSNYTRPTGEAQIRSLSRTAVARGRRVSAMGPTEKVGPLDRRQRPRPSARLIPLLIGPHSIQQLEDRTLRDPKPTGRIELSRA